MMNNFMKTFKKISTHYRNNKSSSYITLIAIIILFYIFIGIQSFLKDPTHIFSDEIKNESIVAGDVKLNLEEEKYNPDNGLYILKYKATSTSNKAIVVNKDILKINVFMEKGITKISDVNIYFPLNNYFIIEVKNLPKDYKALKITFKLEDKSNDISTSNKKEVSQFTSADNKIKDYKLLPKTKTQYYVEAYKVRLKEIEKQINSLKSDIKKSDERKVVLIKENESLNPNDPTLSTKEQQIAKETIESNKSEISAIESDYKQKQQEIKENEKTKQQIETKLQSLN